MSDARSAPGSKEDRLDRLERLCEDALDYAERDGDAEAERLIVDLVHELDRLADDMDRMEAERDRARADAADSHQRNVELARMLDKAGPSAVEDFDE